MQILVGTSGYAYKEWRGSFYPEKMKEKDMLRYYAERFPAVEINNTFYRLPARETLLRWAERGAPRLRLRAEGLAAHHPPPAAPPESKETVDYLFDVASRARRPARARPLPDPALPEEGPRPAARLPRLLPAGARRSPSSSATRRWLDEEVYARCARATRPSSAPTPRSRARRALRSCRPRTGATCACAAATTTTRASRRWAERIRAQPWQRGLRLLQARGRPAARLAGDRALPRLGAVSRARRPGSGPPLTSPCHSARARRRRTGTSRSRRRRRPRP